MDIDALHSTLLSITVVSQKLRDARERLLTNEETSPRVGKLLTEVEGDLNVAKATLAGELGFRLCPHCWPPELITTDRQGRPNCAACGPLSFEQAA
jgi:hypothetical protein